MSNNKEYVDTKYFAEKWKVSKKTVSNYCKNGYIPGAAIVNNKWSIPVNSIKPPTKDKINNLLILVNSLKHNTDLEIDYKTLGIDQRDISLVYRYLASMKFITIPNNNINEDRIPYEARLKERGLDIIYKLQNKKRKVDIDSKDILYTLVKLIPSIIALAKLLLDSKGAS